MNKAELEQLNSKGIAKAAVKLAADVFKCETTEKLKELCYDIIDAINYLND